MVILAATLGPRAGAGVLQSQELLAPHFGGILRGAAGIGRWGDAYDPGADKLINEEDRIALTSALAAIAEEPVHEKDPK